jgi:hypothetical protein
LFKDNISDMFVILLLLKFINYKFWGSRSFKKDKLKRLLWDKFNIRSDELSIGKGSVSSLV